jgi:hypothetical protein
MTPLAVLCGVRENWTTYLTALSNNMTYSSDDESRNIHPILPLDHYTQRTLHHTKINVENAVRARWLIIQYFLTDC